jgi:hypothetical protein
MTRSIQTTQAAKFRATAVAFLAPLILTAIAHAQQPAPCEPQTTSAKSKVGTLPGDLGKKPAPCQTNSETVSSGSQDLPDVNSNRVGRGEIGKTDEGQIPFGDRIILWRQGAVRTEIPEIINLGWSRQTGGQLLDFSTWLGTDRLGNKYILLQETDKDQNRIACRITYSQGQVTATRIPRNQVPEGLDESWGDYHPVEENANEGDSGTPSGNPITPTDDSGKHGIYTLTDEDTRVVTLVAGSNKPGGTSVWQDDKTGETFLVKKDGSSSKATKLGSSAKGSTWHVGRGTTVVITNDGQATFSYDQTK